MVWKWKSKVASNRKLSMAVIFGRYNIVPNSKSSLLLYDRDYKETPVYMEYNKILVNIFRPINTKCFPVPIVVLKEWPISLIIKFNQLYCKNFITKSTHNVAVVYDYKSEPPMY